MHIVVIDDDGGVAADRERAGADGVVDTVLDLVEAKRVALEFSAGRPGPLRGVGPHDEKRNAAEHEEGEHRNTCGHRLGNCMCGPGHRGRIYAGDCADLAFAEVRATVPADSSACCCRWLVTIYPPRPAMPGLVDERAWITEVNEHQI